MITALLYNSCTSCRKTEAILRESGVDYKKREYFKERFTKVELRSLLESANLAVSDVISTRSRPYKELDLATRQLPDDQVLEMMIEEPRLLRRPIVIRDGDAVVGHNETTLRELISSDTRDVSGGTVA